MIRTVIILLGLLSPQAAEPAPVPEGAAQKEAEKLIKDLFKDEYAAKAPADRLILAKKLAEQSEETKDDAALRYVLLRESINIAAAACDIRLAMKSADRLARTFKTDAVLLKSETLQSLIKNSKTVDEASQISAAFLKLSKEATDVDDFAGAEKAVSAAAAQAKKAQNTLLTNRSAVRAKEVADLKGKFDKIRKMKEALAANPEDPAANLDVGQYECFSKSNWAVGVGYLAKGSDATLKDLASRDLGGGGATPAEQAAIGDGWWDLGEKKTPGRDEARRRAAFWYEKAVGKLTGLALTKTDKRLFELRGEVLTRGTWLDVSDPKLYGQNGAVVTPRKGHTLKLTKPPEGEFDGLTLHVRIPQGSTAEFRVEYEVNSRAIYIFQKLLQSNTLDKNTWHAEVSMPCPAKDEFVFHVLMTDGEYVGYVDRKEFFRVATGREILTVFEIMSFTPELTVDQIKLRRRQ